MDKAFSPVWFLILSATLGWLASAQVARANSPAGGPRIFDFNPKTGGVGTVITIDGQGFADGEPDDHCIVLDLGGAFLDIRCISATSNRLTGVLQNIPPPVSGQPHHLMVGVGDGIRQAVNSGSDNIVVETVPLPWIWTGEQTNSTTAQGSFVPVAALPAGGSPPGFFSGSPVDGKLHTIVGTEWTGCSYYSIHVRSHGVGGLSDTYLFVSIDKPSSGIECAQVFCDIITAALGSAVDCTVSTNAVGVAIITLEKSNGVPIVGGMFHIWPQCTGTRICCPGDQVLECTGPLTLLTDCEVSATSFCNPIPVTCVPPLEDGFPVGVTTVNCSAAPVSCSFTVTVSDHVTPSISGATNIVVNCPGPIGPYPVIVSDLCDTNPVVTFDPSSGFSFPLGSTTVMVTATDSAGNSTNTTFTVTVLDSSPPVLDCPTNIAVNCTGPDGEVISFEVTATDDCCPPEGCEIVCVPPSGSIFPIGTTTVICTTSDTSGNTNSCTFDVSVLDTVPPAITCTSTIVECAGPAGTLVSFSPSVSDLCDDDPLVICVPPSGSTFPLGTNHVSCTVTDAAGNTNMCEFTVTVQDTLPPNLACPTNQTLECTSPDGAIATFVGVANDQCCPPYPFPGGGGPILVNEWMPFNESFLADPSDNEFESWIEVYNTSSAAVDLSGFFLVDRPQSPTPAPFPQGTVIAPRSTLMIWTDGEPEQSGPQGHDPHVDIRLSRDGGFIGIVDSQGRNVDSVHYPAHSPDTSGGRTPDGSGVIGVLSIPTPGTVNATLTVCLIPVECTPASGSTFPIGTNLVTCTAEDALGNTSICTFTIDVIDTVPPDILCPPDLIVDCTNALINIVDFVVTATDTCDPDPTVTCTPASGSAFPLGINTVVCIATDASGNSTSCTFKVVLIDSTPTTILSVKAGCGLDKITITFSAPVDPTTALDIGNYSISPSGTLSDPQFGADSSTICLDVDGLVGGDSYELTVTGLKDTRGKDILGGDSVPIEATGDILDVGVDIAAVYPDPLESPCCGQEMTYIVTYDNHGTAAVCDPTIRLLYSPLLTFVSYTATPAIPAPTPCSMGMATHCLDWTLPEILYPGDSGVIYVTVVMDDCPPDNPGWMPDLTAKATIKPFAMDSHKPDNIAMHHVTALCSFDPNDKQVRPRGCGPLGLIPGDQTLTYTIQFQNIGSGPTARVILRDDLDDDLDLSTLELIAASHPHTFAVTGREMVWTFDPLVLPASAVDEPGSHGYVKYRVDPLPGLPIGRMLTNQARIFFDLNPPVLTSITTNTISDNPLPVAAFAVLPEVSDSGHIIDFAYTGGTSGVTFEWNFGPGATPETSTEENPTGVLFPEGSRFIVLRVALGECVSEAEVRVITPGTPELHVERSGDDVTFWWDEDGYVLEKTSALGPDARWERGPYMSVYNGRYNVTIPQPSGSCYFRLVEGFEP